MIFVTVGTHEQPFDRLIKCIDKLVKDGVIAEEVIVQRGYSAYNPKHCKWSDFFTYSEMGENIDRARIVITHGGPSSFIMALQRKRIPIVVPRRKEFGEHINNHQVEFCKTIEERLGTIIVIENINELAEKIQNYENIIAEKGVGINSNNKRFCAEFERLVDEIMRK